LGSPFFGVQGVLSLRGSERFQVVEDKILNKERSEYRKNYVAHFGNGHLAPLAIAIHFCAE
jgi:hypothetical protein